MRRTNLDCCAIAHTEAVEDYLKSIFLLSGREEQITTTGLAGYLGVAAPTVSAMVKRLAAHDLVNRADDHLIRLTEHGERHAMGVVRRHRLVETFLAKTLGMPWDEVHAEAEVLEHAISPRLEELIDNHLGHPSHDPHGDPIPQASGRHVETWATSLSVVAPGTRFRVERVSDRDGSALRYLADLGIRPGAVVDVLERAPFGGPLWVLVDDRRHALGAEITSAVHGRVQ